MPHCKIPADPDIDGLGVRLALYAQYFIAHLVFLISPENAGPSWLTTVVTAVVLDVTTWVYKPHLSPYHALFVTWLTFPALPFTRLYETSAGYDGFDGFLRFIGGSFLRAIYAGYALWVWTSVSNVDSINQCTYTVVFAFFGRIDIGSAIHRLLILLLCFIEFLALSPILRVSVEVAERFTSSLVATCEAAIRFPPSLIATLLASYSPLIPPLPAVLASHSSLPGLAVRFATDTQFLRILRHAFFGVIVGGLILAYVLPVDLASPSISVFSTIMFTSMITTSVTTDPNLSDDVYVSLIASILRLIFILLTVVVFVVVFGITAGAIMVSTIATVSAVVIICPAAYVAHTIVGRVFHMIGKDLQPISEIVEIWWKERRGTKIGALIERVLRTLAATPDIHPLNWITPSSLTTDVQAWTRLLHILTSDSTMASVVWLSISIVMMELMVRWNEVEVNGVQWSYGQIFPVVMLIFQIVSLCSVILWKESNQHSVLSTVV